MGKFKKVKTNELVANHLSLSMSISHLVSAEVNLQ